MLAFDFGDLVNFAADPKARQAIQGLPQTRKDLRTLAQAAEEARSPAVAARIERLESRLETYGKTQLLLQTASTAAVVGLFILAWKGKG